MLREPMNVVRGGVFSKLDGSPCENIFSCCAGEGVVFFEENDDDVSLDALEEGGDRK